ncbi:MAG: YjjG family noncanonical pyrimidine nucleotidase [Vallitalea sp.]|jgi:YjjG family noncanonical pyrimidine nucleotidase|nr:YjjG family noncanonical pyrimidine nucleotidase [Vallitalea sp.]
MYKYVIFDADNTLLDFTLAEKYSLTEALKQFSYKGDLDKILYSYREINRKIWLELEKGKISNEELKEERFKRLFKKFNLDYNIHKFSEVYLENLSESGYLINGAKEICKYLKEKKYKVVVLTNGIKKIQESRIEKSSIKQFIDLMIVSQEVGVNKPDPYIFEYTLKKFGSIDKNDAIMIGDSLTADIKGGINYGIDTCWFNLNKVENNTDIISKYEIKCLDELKNIL